MKLFLGAVITALLVPSIAMATPQTDFTVMRILPNGNKITLSATSITDTTLDALARATAQAAARQNRTNNPAWHIVIFCPTDNPTGYTDDDICWDSQTDL